jgi:hypothetical protein
MLRTNRKTRRSSLSSEVSNTRVQVRLNSVDFARLAKIQKRLDAPSQIDAIRKSLRIAEWYLGAREQGHVAIVQKNGKTKQVDVII